MSELFKHIGVGQFPSASEYNRLVDAVGGLLKSTGVQYMSDSRGMHVRRMPQEHEKTLYSLGYHGGGTLLAVPTDTLTTIPLDFAISDPDGWRTGDGFVVPYDGIYSISAVFYVVYGVNTDVVAYILGRVDGGGFHLKSIPEVTLSIAAIPFAMLFGLSGMVELAKDDLFLFQFWHEAGGANTMEMSNTAGAQAGIWLVERT